jgi:hypothetical protein
MKYRIYLQRQQNPNPNLFPSFPIDYHTPQIVSSHSFEEVAKSLPFKDGDVIVNPMGLKFRLIHEVWEEID